MRLRSDLFQLTIVSIIILFEYITPNIHAALLTDTFNQEPSSSYNSSSSLFPSFTWQRLGYDLTGPDLHGWSLALNHDGSVAAVGSILSNGPFGDAPSSGMVTMYQWNEMEWQTTQIHGLHAGDQCGYSVSLDWSGTVVAMGSPKSNGETSLAVSGQVRVMEYNGVEWSPRGEYIGGSGGNYLCGYAVALAKDGETLTTGCPFANIQTGVSFSFYWGEDAWYRWGSDIDGQDENGNSGASVAINSIGTVMALGTPNQLVNDEVQTGSVQAYRYNWLNTEWEEKGQALNGDASGDKFGYSVAMSDSGNILACGAPYNSNTGKKASGMVRVYQWNATDNIWIQLGYDITGSGEGDQFGGSLAISSMGSIIAVGAHLADTRNGNNTGAVLMYGWDGQKWNQIGEDLIGDSPKDYFGWSVALSGDGEVVAIGAPYADTGRVRLFRRLEINTTKTSAFNSTHTGDAANVIDASMSSVGPTVVPLPFFQPTPLSDYPTTLPPFPDVNDAISASRSTVNLAVIAVTTLVGSIISLGLLQ